MLIKFPVAKRKTPDEFQVRYMATFWLEARRVLPWVLIIPALLLFGCFAFIPEVMGHLEGATFLLRLTVVYVVLAVGLWFVIGPRWPDASEGMRTRVILDASRKEYD
mgnify:CR=1 FL=1|jgi:hypothetical protein